MFAVVYQQLILLAILGMVVIFERSRELKESKAKSLGH